MKLIKNSSLRTKTFQDLDGPESYFLILKFISKKYVKILFKHFEYQQCVKDGIWNDVHTGINYISNSVECNEKTVDRFHKDFQCLVQSKKGYKNGKRTSNKYKMQKGLYQFLKICWKLGLGKKGTCFKERFDWIYNLWEKSGCNMTRFANSVYNRKPMSSRDIDKGSKSYEQSEKKMSPSNRDKCPSILDSLTRSMISTPFGDSKISEKMEKLLKMALQKTYKDVEWYLQNSGKKILSPISFMAKILSGNLLYKKRSGNTLNSFYT